MIYNLIRNALDAFEEHGEGKRDLLVKTNRLNSTHVELMVEDTGPGIEKEDLTSIFSPFFSRKDNGLGMGLAVSRSIAEAHGGTITVESTRGQGTRFRFRIPLEQRAADQV